jgi:hypothetical protein
MGGAAAERGIRARLPRGVLGGDRAVLLLCLLVWAPIVARTAMGLPVLPGRLGTDSEEYLTLAAHRPPLYGWLLAAYRWATGGLEHLPLLQLALLAAGLLFFAVELGRMLRSAIAGAAAVLLATRHLVVHDAPAAVMTEGLFLALLLAGLGLLFHHVRRDGVGAAPLVAASVCFALAAATRTTGTALLPLAPLLALLDHRLRPRAAILRAAWCATAMAAVLAVAVAGNWARHGRAEIGSFAGIALLGKALMLIGPADLPALPPAAASTVPVAEGARRRIEAQPDLAARLRAHLQSSQDVRFGAFFPAAEAQWPAWRDAASWRERSDLGLGVALRLVADHPLGFLRLWARDWAALLLYPGYRPAWASADVGDPRAFPACRLQGNCWALTRYGVSPLWLGAMLAVSLGGAAVGLVVLLGVARPVPARRAMPATALAWCLGLVLHASLLLTSLAEAGFARYTAGLHVLGTALVLWAAVEASRRVKLAASRTTVAPDLGARG